MAVVVTTHCTHGDKIYEAGDIVKTAKVSKVLLNAGLAEESEKKETEENTEEE